jgi:competence protein ComEA
VAVVVAGAAGTFLIAATPHPEIILANAASDAASSPASSAAPAAAARGGALSKSVAAASQRAFIVVDVEGGVAHPGLYRMPAGGRVGEAIHAAGGFGRDVDTATATRDLNLAAPLEDGAKVQVPVRGASPAPVAAAPTFGAATNARSAGLVDLNRASQGELESLPGIGPVTAAHIVTARAEAPFRTVDELQERKLVRATTFEKIRALVTVGN